jgi:hypothetical protein
MTPCLAWPGCGGFLFAALLTYLNNALKAMLLAHVLQGDISLMGALAAEVLLPGLRVGVPEDPAAAKAAAAVAAPATATKDASPAGKHPGSMSGAGVPRRIACACCGGKAALRMLIG